MANSGQKERRYCPYLEKSCQRIVGQNGTLSNKSVFYNGVYLRPELF